MYGGNFGSNVNITTGDYFSRLLENTLILFNGVAIALTGSIGNIYIILKDIANPDNHQFSLKLLSDTTLNGIGQYTNIDFRNTAVTTTTHAYDTRIQSSGGNDTDGKGTISIIAQYLGINTTTPLYNFHVAGTAYISGAVTFASSLIISGTANLVNIIVSGTSTFAGKMAINNVTNVNNSVTDGSLVIKGGVGIEKDIIVKNNGTIQNDFYVNGDSEFDNLITSYSELDATDVNSAAITTAGGIGVAKNLFVGGDIQIAGFKLFNSTSENTMGILSLNGNQDFYIYGLGQGKNIHINNNKYSNAGDVYINDNSNNSKTLIKGYVGINQTNPAAELDVTGIIKCTKVEVDNVFSLFNNGIYNMGLYINDATKDFCITGVPTMKNIRINNDKGTNSGDVYINNGSNNSKTLINGYVGINQTAPSVELDVNGTIKCTKLSINNGFSFFNDPTIMGIKLDNTTKDFVIHGPAAAKNVHINYGKNLATGDVLINTGSFNSSTIINGNVEMNGILTTNNVVPEQLLDFVMEGSGNGRNFLINANKFTNTGELILNQNSPHSKTYIHGPVFITGATDMPSIPGYLSVSGEISATKISTTNFTTQYNHASGYVSLVNSATLPQGAYMSWNNSTTGGETNFINQRGDGTIGGFNFYDKPNVSTSSTKLMTITGSGAVGIGVATPSYKLAVAGDGNFTTNLIVNDTISSNSCQIENYKDELGNKLLLQNCYWSGLLNSTTNALYKYSGLLAERISQGNFRFTFEAGRKPINRHYHVSVTTSLDGTTSSSCPLIHSVDNRSVDFFHVVLITQAGYTTDILTNGTNTNGDGYISVMVTFIP